MGLSFWHLLLILIVVFVIFGAGKLPKVMGDVGKGIRHLREGLKGEEAAIRRIKIRLSFPRSGNLIIAMMRYRFFCGADAPHWIPAQAGMTKEFKCSIFPLPN